MEFPELIEGLCETLGIDKPADPGARKFVLTLDELHTCELELLADNSGFILFSLLAPVVKGYSQKVCEELLRANSFGRITNNAVISLSDEKSAFVLSERIMFNNLEVKPFLQQLEEFAKIVLYLEEKIALWQAQCLTEPEKQPIPANQTIIKP